MPITHGGLVIPPDAVPAGKTLHLVQKASGRWAEVDCWGSPTDDAAIVEPANADLVTAAAWAMPIREARAGGTPYHLLAASSINATVLKNSPGRLLKVHCFNPQFGALAYPVYLKFYNKASSVPAPASDTALLVQAVGCQAGVATPFPISRDGINFSTGIGFAIVKGIANNDATVVVAGDLLIALEYL